MWNRKKEDELPPRPVMSAVTPPAPPPPPPPQPQGVSMSTPAYRNEPEIKSGAGAASIGKNVSITGQINSREDLFVDGEVDGTIELQENRLTVGKNGKVKAGVHAREVIILGTVQGNVEATEKVEIKNEARLVGDIRTARIVIEDGALFKGSIDIVRPDPKTAPAPAAKPQPVTATATPPAATPAAPQQQPLAAEAKR